MHPHGCMSRFFRECPAAIFYLREFVHRHKSLLYTLFVLVPRFNFSSFQFLDCETEALTNMIIGDRLRALREEKKLSQGEIEKRTGLLRCYISRVENGHTVPAVETLEKFARALEVPVYQLFYDGEEPPKVPSLLTRGKSSSTEWGSSGKNARVLAKFCRLLGRANESDRRLLFFMAQKMARAKSN
jgi:transcriptional regulator with XRE-family HTH domain